MAATKLAVANMALSSIGARRLIASVDEKSREAELVRTFYDLARDDVFALTHWPSLKKSARLALASTGSSPWDNTMPGQRWKYAYVLPDDYVLPRVLTCGSNFEVMVIGEETLLHTNVQSPILEYTAKRPEHFWDPALINAVVATLAQHIALPLTGDKARLQLAVGLAKEAREVDFSIAANTDDRQQLPWSDGSYWLGNRACGNFGKRRRVIYPTTEVDTIPPVISSLWGLTESAEWVLNGPYGLSEDGSGGFIWTASPVYMLDDLLEWQET